MSTPLTSEKVKEIRDIFDSQEKNPDKTAIEARQPNLSLKKKELLEELLTVKERLDVQMDRFRNARPLDQTMDVAAGEQTWMRSSDESFLRWEQDCETTISQPSAVAVPRKPASRDPEMAAIESLMREYNLDNPENADTTEENLDVADQTQLADVEPPSGIWENTMIAGKMMASPMMMFTRPSTIIEETMSSNVANDSSLASSYKTARSGGYEYSKATDRYDTAAETISSEGSGSDIIEILDDTIESSGKTQGSNSVRNSGDSAGAATMDGISSLAPDYSYGKSTVSGRDSGDDSFPDSKDSLLDTPDFNDTLERIEYMEEQGKKLLEQQKNTPLLAKTLLPTTSIKKVFYPSPNSSSSSAVFKKPAGIRSPQVKFIPPKRNFDHIVSPIATYIKDVPTSTLYTKYKGQCLFSKNSPIKPNTPTKKEDTKENQQSLLKPPQWNIPRKVFTTTNNRHEIDTRLQTKTPGGNKVHQMIHTATDNPHKIIKHEGRVKTGLQPPRNQPRDSIFDETLANMSVVSGDVSIQVIRDLKRH